MLPIQLTSASDGAPVWVNPEQIVTFREWVVDGEHLTKLRLTDDEVYVVVSETPPTILEKLSYAR